MVIVIALLCAVMMIFYRDSFGEFRGEDLVVGPWFRYLHVFVYIGVVHQFSPSGVLFLMFGCRCIRWSCLFLFALGEVCWSSNKIGVIFYRVKND